MITKFIDNGDKNTKRFGYPELNFFSSNSFQKIT